MLAKDREEQSAHTLADKLRLLKDTEQHVFFYREEIKVMKHCSPSPF
jgi:ferritin